MGVCELDVRALGCCYSEDVQSPGDGSVLGLVTTVESQ